MSNSNKLKFQSNKSARQNINIFLNYLKKDKSPFSKILLSTFKENLNEDDFRRKIKDKILAHLKKVSEK